MLPIEKLLSPKLFSLVTTSFCSNLAKSWWNVVIWSQKLFWHNPNPASNEQNFTKVYQYGLVIGECYQKLILSQSKPLFQPKNLFYKSWEVCNQIINNFVSPIDDATKCLATECPGDRVPSNRVPRALLVIECLVTRNLSKSNWKVVASYCHPSSGAWKGNLILKWETHFKICFYTKFPFQALTERDNHLNSIVHLT